MTTTQQAVEEIDRARRAAASALADVKANLDQINSSVDDAFSAMAEEEAMKEERH